EVQYLLDLKHPTVLVCVETGNTPLKLLPSYLPSYHRYFTAGTNAHGGVLILVHMSVPSKLVHTEPNILDVEVSLGCCRLNVIGVYSPRSSPLPIKSLRNIVTTNTARQTLLIGDLNAYSTSWGCSTTDRRGFEVSSLPKWIRDEIAVLHNLRNRYYRRYTIERYNQYIVQRQFVHFWIKEHRVQQWEGFLKTCSTGDSSYFWRYTARHFQSSAPHFKGLQSNNIIDTNPISVVEQLYQHYREHFRFPSENLSPVAESVIEEEYGRARTLYENSPNPSPLTTTYTEVAKILKRIRPKRALDVSGTSNFLLRQLPLDFVGILVVCFNRLLGTNSVTEHDKIARMIFHSKAGSYPTISELRPISILNAIGKLYEKIMYTYLQKWMIEKKVIPTSQSGFQPGVRLQTRVLSLYEAARASIASNRPGLILFVDFASAFDKVWHKALLVKLSRYDIPGQYWLWIRNWLSERSAYISFCGLQSDLFDIEWGLPQGSVLSPLIYLPYVADLNDIKEPARKNNWFADDWSLFIEVPFGIPFGEACPLLQRLGQQALDNIREYCDYWLIELSVKKTVGLIVHSQVQVATITLKYNSHTISMETKVTNLGYGLTSKLGLGAFLNSVCQKIAASFRIVSAQFARVGSVSINLRRRCFFAFVYPCVLSTGPV
ncbi:unnamed protein product, partial [Didymodactylos carnosus]